MLPIVQRAVSVFVGLAEKHDGPSHFDGRLLRG